MPAVARGNLAAPAVQAGAQPNPWTSSHDAAQCYGHSARVFEVAFKPGAADAMASVADDQMVRLWQLGETGSSYEQTGWCRGHSTTVLRVAWSPDAALLASGDSGGTVKLWRPPQQDASYSGREVAELGGHPEEVYYCDFLGRGGGEQLGAPAKQLLVGSSTDLFLWDLETETLLCKGQPPPETQNALAPEDMPPYIFGAARHPTSGQLATCCSDGAVRLWEVGQQALELVVQYNLTEEMLTCCCFSPDGHYLAVVGRSGTLLLLELRQGEVLLQLKMDRPAISCSFVTLQGVLWLAVVGGDSAIRLMGFFAGPGVKQAVVKVPGSYTAPLLTLAVAADGASFAVAGEAMAVESLGGAARRRRGGRGADAASLTNGLAALGLAVTGGAGGDDDALFRELPRAAAPAAPRQAPGAKHSSAEECDAGSAPLQQAPIFVWRHRGPAAV